MKKIPANKKILIIGAGSIGRRHATNLSLLGCDIAIHDVNKVHLDHVCSEHNYSPVYDVESAVKTDQFDAAIICTPNQQHITSAIPVVEAGLDVFIEKPLSDSMDGVDDLLAAIRRSSCIAMAGFNLRFEPGLAYIKRTIDPSKVAFARSEFGFYLPEWRKGVDYRKIYSANKSMGGGIILDDIHEIDYPCWLMGYPEKLQCSFGKFSNLEIDVEDVADIQLTYPDKLVSIHMDYLQRKYSRRCKICMKDGCIIEWIFGDRVIIFGSNGETEEYCYAPHFDPNLMYIEEMTSFLQSINDRIQPESGLDNAVKILQLAMLAKHQHIVESESL